MKQESIDAIVRLLKQAPEPQPPANLTPGEHELRLVLQITAEGVTYAEGAAILHKDRLEREATLRAALRAMGAKYASHVLNLGKLGTGMARRRRQVRYKTEECKFLIGKLEERDVPREVTIGWLKGFHEAQKKAGRTEKEPES